MPSSLTISRSSSLERIRCEVNSKCASLRAAACLLAGLSAPDSEEMLLLMTQDAALLVKSLEKYGSQMRTSEETTAGDA